MSKSKYESKSLENLYEVQQHLLESVKIENDKTDALRKEYNRYHRVLNQARADRVDDDVVFNMYVELIRKLDDFMKADLLYRHELKELKFVEIMIDIIESG